MVRLVAVLAVVVGLVVPAPASAAGPGLVISVGHAPSHVLPGMVAAYLTITVANKGGTATTGPVTVTDTLPAGLTVTAAAGDGWACVGTRCTRNDALAPGSAYPPIRIVVDVAADVPAELVNTATIEGGGSATDRIPARDACPYGWAPEQTVSFDRADSEVRNPQRPNGCTLLDAIWAAEPFSSHGRFVDTVRREADAFLREGLLTRRQRHAIVVAAVRSDVGGKGDRQIDNSCDNRIALTFDDGTSAFRPALLKVLRDKQVHATFFDNGVRVEANPRIAAFQVREGHVELNHSYLHVHMDQLPAEANREEVLHNEAVLAAAGAPITFTGIRPPFGGSNTAVQRLLIEMGYTYFLNRINAEDWLPDKTAAAIHDDIVAQLRPGVIIGLHDGPVDTTAGVATVEATARIIDTARRLGYCFGVVSPSGHVVADRYTPSGRPIPRITNPVPYHLPLAFGTVDRIPRPWVRIPSPIQITAAHTPATFVRGETGTLTLSVTNTGGTPTDGAAVTVQDAMPAGLTATGAAGAGWSCTVGATVTCTRTDVLAPRSAYPPITITATVAAGAPPTLTNEPTLTGHGGSWTDEASDPISVR